MPNRKQRYEIVDDAKAELDESREAERLRCKAEKKLAKKRGYVRIDAEPVVVIPTLVRLDVTHAELDATGWWTSRKTGDPVRIKATTAPDDSAGEWAQIGWGGAGGTESSPRWRGVDRGAVAANLVVTAALNGPPQQVLLDVFDVTALTCANLAATGVANRWKGYAGYVPGNVAQMSATTSPAESRVWSHLRWAPAGTQRLTANQNDQPATAVGDHPVKVTLRSRSITGTLHLCQWPALAVRSIAFSGGHTINNDTSGSFDNHWQLARAVGDLDPAPLCYSRNVAASLSVTLTVATPPTDPETVRVRGSATVNGVNITWTSAPIVVNPGAAAVSFAAPVAGSAPLATAVAALTGGTALTIQWTMTDPNGAWIAIGSTRHNVYVTLGNPVAGTPVYRTLLHHSCTGAAGATTDQQLVTGAFAQVATRALTRQRDNVPLTYWNPQAAAKPNGSTALMLGEPTGAGHCGAWAEFLVDTFRIHGVTTGHKVNVRRTAQVAGRTGGILAMLPDATKRGFLVATWNFGAVPATSATELTHTMRGTCMPGVHAPGQNNPTPPPAFYNHFVVHCTTDGRIYDPSYGHHVGTPLAWEAASISGLYSDAHLAYPTAGYHPTGAARLLEFKYTAPIGTLL